MKLSLHSLATPLVAGSFLISAVTGVLLFFHLDSGLNKFAHEWVGWVMIFGVIVHVVSNYKCFVMRLTKPVSWGIIGLFAIVLLASFIPVAQDRAGGGVGRAAMDRLVAAPLSVVAQVARKDVDTLIADLEKGGIDVDGADQSIRDLSGRERRQEMVILSKIFN